MNEIIKIKTAQPEDQQLIKDLLKTCHLPWEDITPEHLPHFFVLQEDGKLIGTIGMEICGGYGLVRSLAVSEAHRGRGIGVRLTRIIEDYARSIPLQALFLLTMTAEPFFSKQGYEVINRDKAPRDIQATGEFKSICPSSATCMMIRIKNDRKSFTRTRAFLRTGTF